MNIGKRQNLLIIGDIHGMYDELSVILKHYEPKEDTLVVLGDVIDKGIQSREVLNELFSIYSDNTKSFVYIRGNHEDMFLSFLEYPTQVYKEYFEIGGKETLISLLGEKFVSQHTNEPDVLVQKLKDKYKGIIEMLKDSILYYQRNNVLCVHAGVDPTLKDFKMTSDNDFMWIRDEFIESKRVWKYEDSVDHMEKPLKIIHGHTPNEKAPIIAYNRINIDSGCCFGGSLTGILLNQYGDIQNIYKVNTKYHNRKPIN